MHHCIQNVIVCSCDWLISTLSCSDFTSSLGTLWYINTGQILLERQKSDSKNRHCKLQHCELLLSNPSLLEIDPSLLKYGGGGDRSYVGLSVSYMKKRIFTLEKTKLQSALLRCYCTGLHAALKTCETNRRWSTEMQTCRLNDFAVTTFLH